MRMKTIRVIIISSLVLVLAATYLFLQLRQEAQKMLSEDPRVWEEVITEFEIKDQDNPPPENAILFIGSSSIRLWDTLSEDMLPLIAFGRGFGGAKIIDVSYYVSRIVTPYQPKAIVVYIGGNDFSDLLGNQVKTLAQARLLYNQLRDRLKSAAPNAAIFFIALKPTSKNWHQWRLLQTVNQYLFTMAQDDDSLFYIDANADLLTEQGTPNSDYLMFDGIHSNSEGYRVWGAKVKQFLLDNIQ